MIRSIGAVLAGLLATVVLVLILGFLSEAVTGQPPTAPPTSSYLILNLLGGALAGATGGAVAASIAASRPHGHVGALAVAILLLSLPMLLSAPAPGQPAWYPLVLSVLGPVAVGMGGLLAIRLRGIES